MITRRNFLKNLAYLAAASKLNMMMPGAALASPENKNHNITGEIIAACQSPIVEGEFSYDKYGTVLSSFDLETGKVKQVPIKMQRAHDAVKVHDGYLIIPNKRNEKMRITDFSGNGQTIDIDDRLSCKGHGYFDQQNNVIIVPTDDHQKSKKGFFVVIDPNTFKVIDTIESNSYAPHDIQLLNENTFAVCNYNIKKFQKRADGNAHLFNNANHSEITLYDRKTLELKNRMPAYKGALVSHATITKDHDLFAIGFQHFKHNDLKTWSNERIHDELNDFFQNNHPELALQWPQIAESLNLHDIEKMGDSLGLPLLPLKIAANGNQMETLNIHNFHHRRAQSICYVQQSNTICASFPNSNTIMLYNATTNDSRNLNGKDINLEEVRGITEIGGTPYLAIAGTHRGLTIIDTRNLSVKNHYDVQMGRITHMHHVT